MSTGAVTIYELQEGNKFIFSDKIHTFSHFIKKGMPGRGKVKTAVCFDEDGKMQYFTRDWDVHVL